MSILPDPIPFIAPGEQEFEKLRATSVQRNFDAIDQLFPLLAARIGAGQISASHLATALANLVPASTVTSLPGSPTPGQEVFYVSETTFRGLWHLKYDDTEDETHKWKYVGGPPLYAEVTTDQSTASGTYAALATAGPSIALPLAGDYMVTTGFLGYNNTAGAWFNKMSYDIGGTAAVDADAVSVAGDNATAIQDSASRTRRKTGLSAVTLTAKYRVSGGTGNFLERWMSVLPVRVS